MPWPQDLGESIGVGVAVRGWPVNGPEIVTRLGPGQQKVLILIIVKPLALLLRIDEHRIIERI